MAPEGWKMKALGDLLDLSSGKRPILTNEGPVPVYGGNGLMGWTADPLRSESTVVIGRVGSPGTVHRTDGPVWISDNALYAKGVSDEMLFDFLPWLLDYERLGKYATRSSHPSLSQRAVSRVRVSLPPLPEQRKIAAILSSVDDAIAATRKVIEQTKRVKQGLLQTLMTRGIGHTRFKKTEIGEIPEAWEVVPILDLCAIRSGQVDPREEPYSDLPLIAPNHIESETGRLLQVETAAEQGAISGKYEVSSGDVVYSKIRPYLRKAWLSDRKCLCSADMYPVAAGPDIVPSFLFAVLLSGDFSRYTEAVSMRTGIPKVNREELAGYRLALPPLDEQEKVTAILNGLDESIAREEAMLADFDRMKTGLLQDLLTGRVRVQPD